MLISALIDCQQTLLLSLLSSVSMSSSSSSSPDISSGRAFLKLYIISVGHGIPHDCLTCVCAVIFPDLQNLKYFPESHDVVRDVI